MKQDWKSLPPALQHQLIIQMGLAVCCLVLAIGALAFISFSVSVPFLLGAALLTSVPRACTTPGCGDSISFSAGLS